MHIWFRSSCEYAWWKLRVEVNGAELLIPIFLPRTVIKLEYGNGSEQESGHWSFKGFRHSDSWFNEKDMSQVHLNLLFRCFSNFKSCQLCRLKLQDWSWTLDLWSKFEVEGTWYDINRTASTMHLIYVEIYLCRRFMCSRTCWPWNLSHSESETFVHTSCQVSAMFSLHLTTLACNRRWEINFHLIFNDFKETFSRRAAWSWNEVANACKSKSLIVLV